MAKKRVVTLNNDYTNEKIAKQQEGMKAKLPNRKHMGIISIIAMIIFALSSINLVATYKDLREKRGLETTYVKDNKDLESKNAIKEKQVAKLQNDDYVAKFARAKYFYMRDDELVYNIPELIATNNTEEDDE